MWVYEFTCTKCGEAFVRSLGSGRPVRCPGCGSSALDPHLDPLSELVLLLLTAATRGIGGLRQRIGAGSAMRWEQVASGR